MKLTETLDCPASYFYNKLVDSILYDIHQNTSDRPLKEDLSGFQYTKKFSNSSSATMMIEKLEKDTCYMYTSKTTRKTYHVSYHIKSIDDEHCRVDYEEIIDGEGLLDVLNDWVVGLFSSYGRKKQFKNMLHMMAKDYQLTKS